MSKKSAGVLMYRFTNGQPEVLLVHPGGPFWAKKDLGAWSIPKGELNDNEDALSCARREFEEETGHSVNGEFIELSPQKLKSGKLIIAWAIEDDFDPKKLKSNSFEMEWPPRSGKINTFDEVDKAEWFTVTKALEKINPGQAGFIIELQQKLNN